MGRSHKETPPPFFLFVYYNLSKSTFLTAKIEELNELICGLLSPPSLLLGANLFPWKLRR
jgi:hypothetical protein